eukprot:GFKZ01003682.1.p1 GENE.GFKZ01003682.1~~GFKZ01003682.1.p1  ORF type:complete len:535 (+),score=57.58 GFKZ01003682.1:818-2422(+)
MGSSRRVSPQSSSTPRLISSPRSRANLPPKPVSQKRTRNASSYQQLPPPSQPSSSTSRPTLQRGWGRRSASWTPEEDAKLVELVKKEASIPPSITASKTWSRVASQLTNRTGKQCRERYLNQLKPGIRRDPWSPEEEHILREAHKRIGNKWVAIAAQLPGRTDNCVKNHWNSMLRKRQRREAALKAAQAEVAAALKKEKEGDRVDGDRRSDAEFSLRTGCATPSGLSSSYHDIPTSGVPSPYTASSPITPKRDSKLQISNLVASSSKDLPSWGRPHSSTMGAVAIRGDNVANGVDGTAMRQDIAVFNGVDMARANLPSLPPTSAVIHPPQHGIMRMSTQANAGVGSGGLSLNAPYLTKDVASPMQCIASSPHVPQLMQSVRTDCGAGRESMGRPVRRSSRLLSSGCAEDKVEITSISDQVRGLGKAELAAARSLQDGAGAHALVALAAAASSVPPSPLTPESRYSATSRSRSVSPDPRLWPAQGNCIAGSSRTDMRMTRRMAAEMGGGPGGPVREFEEGAGMNRRDTAVGLNRK